MNNAQIETIIDRQTDAIAERAKARKRYERNAVRRLRRKYPGARIQRSSHGAGRHSVQVFDDATGEILADHNVGVN